MITNGKICWQAAGQKEAIAIGRRNVIYGEFIPPAAGAFAVVKANDAGLAHA